MEKLVRLRLEDDLSIEKANALLDKGWLTQSIIPYKGGDYRNQFLLLLALSPEDEERERWNTDDDEDDDLPFDKGDK